MPNTTTITVQPRGHELELVVVRDSGAFVSPVLDTSTEIALRVDPGGNFERVLYGLVQKAVFQGVSTTTNPDDTATWLMPTSGEFLSGGGGGRPEFRDAFVGESVELGAAVASGLVSEGGYNSIGITSGSGVPNNSTVAKLAPVCINLTEPAQTIRDGSLFVRAKVESGDGVDASSVEAVFVDSALAEHTVALSLVGYGPSEGHYSDDLSRVAYIAVWEGTIDVSSAAEGLGYLHIKATGTNGVVADHSVDGDSTYPQTIDSDGSHPEYIAAVDQSFTVEMNGTFTLDQDTIITGATSGVEAIAEEDVDNSGGGTVAVKLVRITANTTAWSAGESINDLTSGSATIVSGTQTPAGSPTAGMIAGGATGNTEADAIAAPFDGLGRAQEYLAQRRVADGQDRNAGGCKVIVLSRHFTKGGYTDSGFGFTVHDQVRRNLRIVGNDPTRGAHNLIGGGDSVSRDQSLFSTMFEDITMKCIHRTDSTKRPWGWASADDVLFCSKRMWFKGLDPDNPTTGQIQGVDETWHEEPLVTDWNTAYTAGSERNRINVCLWADVERKFSDAFQAIGANSGHSYFCGRTYDLRGEASGTHGDVVQWGAGGSENVACEVFADECSYQGIFANNSGSPEYLTRAYVRAFVKQVNDGDIGSFGIAFNLCVNGLIVDLTTSIAPTATVGGEAGKAASINIIPDSGGRSDNVWIRNSAFEGWGAQMWNEDGNADSPWGTVCAVNCHVNQGDALGIRCTSGETLADLFVGPWTNGGESPGNDDTDWRAKADGPLDNRLLARDIIGTHYDMLSGEPIAAGGGIGSAVEAGDNPVDPSAPQPPPRARAAFRGRASVARHTAERHGGAR